jgi:hypothetical protein
MFRNPHSGAAVFGAHYLVQMKSDFDGESWATISQTIYAESSAATWLDCGSGFANTRFYRV